MVGYIMVCSQYMMGADAGISTAMAKLIMPFMVNFGSMIGMPPTGMVALLFFMAQFAIATPAASPVTAVAMTQEMADPGVMTKFALKMVPLLFVFGIAIGWSVANIVF
jgi:hypothetical protein